MTSEQVPFIKSSNLIERGEDPGVLGFETSLKPNFNLIKTPLKPNSPTKTLLKPHKPYANLIKTSLKPH